MIVIECWVKVEHTTVWRQNTTLARGACQSGGGFAASQVCKLWHQNERGDLLLSNGGRIISMRLK